MSEHLLLASERVLRPEGEFSPGWVRVEDGVVVALGEGPPEGIPDVEAAVLSPGFVDIHCHGGGGHSLATADPEEARAAAAAHHRRGTTSVMASLVTASAVDLREQVAALAQLAAEGELLGVHLEGPWLSLAHHGAHDADSLREPDPREIDDLTEVAGGQLLMVTLAPELPGGLEAIQQLTGHGIVAAVGHTDVDERQLREAVEAGARVVTHLCNAMRPVHHRAPGPVVAALEDPRLFVELVADGVHVHPEVLALLVRGARSEVVLISDAMAAADAEDGRYMLGALEVDVRDGVARLIRGGAIAGSTLTLDRAVRMAVSVGMDAAAALTAATRSPARAVGAAAGELAVGARADLLALDEDLHVLQVFRGGVALDPLHE